MHGDTGYPHHQTTHITTVCGAWWHWLPLLPTYTTESVAHDTGLFLLPNYIKFYCLWCMMMLVIPTTKLHTMLQSLVHDDTGYPYHQTTHNATKSGAWWYWLPLPPNYTQCYRVCGAWYWLSPPPNYKATESVVHNDMLSPPRNATESVVHDDTGYPHHQTTHNAAVCGAN